jgi:predicted nucleotidyltransferase
MDLHPDLIDLLTEFGNFGVEYLVVGGWAVGVHAEPRYTKDLDLFIGPSPENLERVATALGRFGAPAGLIDEVRTMASDEFVFFGVPPARVDLLREIPGVAFEQAWARRKTVRWQGVDVHVLGFDDLVNAKRAAGRPKDREDLRLLERFRR